MKRKDEIELRRAIRGAARARRNARMADKWEPAHRLNTALRAASQDTTLSDDAKAFIAATVSTLQRTAADGYDNWHKHDKALNSLALIFGVRP